MAKRIRKYRYDECISCKKVKQIRGRNLCGVCWKLNDNAGTLDNYPCIVNNRDDVMDYYERAHSTMTIAQMAAALGIKPKSLERTINRARRAYDPRSFRSDRRARPGV